MAAPRRVVELAFAREDVAELTRLARSRTEPVSRAERARMLLAYRETPSFYAVGRALGRSDFSRPFIVGYGLRPSRRGPCNDPHGQLGDLPVPLASRLAGTHDKSTGRANSLGAARDLLCLEHLNRTAPAGWPQRMPSRKSRL
jgi:hypothetical protein